MAILVFARFFLREENGVNRRRDNILACGPQGRIPARTGPGITGNQELSDMSLLVLLRLLLFKQLYKEHRHQVYVFGFR
jgi:hypothetical protein